MLERWRFTYISICNLYLNVLLFPYLCSKTPVYQNPKYSTSSFETKLFKKERKVKEKEVL